jgi:hypothetical protein
MDVLLGQLALGAEDVVGPGLPGLRLLQQEGVATGLQIAHLERRLTGTLTVHVNRGQPVGTDRHMSRAERGSG